MEIEGTPDERNAVIIVTVKCATHVNPVEGSKQTEHAGVLDCRMLFRLTQQREFCSWSQWEFENRIMTGREDISGIADPSHQMVWTVRKRQL